MLHTRLFTLFALAFLAGAAAVLHGEEQASETPKFIPQTRPAVKQALEALKHRQPRLPLPEPSDAEREAAGGRISVNNGRMAAHYLPKSWRPARTPRGSGPNSPPSAPETLDYPLATECFWIVSRGNNCHYCLGHQEHKLASVGLSDNRIASLDSDWSVFLPREQAAFALARKLTLAPHTAGDEDIDALREFFTDREIVELVYTIARFNSTNRWTDSLGIPQDKQFRDGEIRFDVPTSPRFREASSLVAPAADQKRPPLEGRAEVELALAACRTRSPRVPLPDEDEALASLPSDWKGRRVPEWVRALTLIGQSGVAQVTAYEAIANEGRIDKRLKAQIAWTCARQDRAWYALADAERRLAALGQGTDRAFALDSPAEALSPAVREALAFAAKLTAAPHAMADADVSRLRKYYSDHEIAEIVYAVCAANMFDRFTETLGLKWTD